MSRYIDADTLKIPSEEMIAKMIIDSAPSIDIVLCEECKHFADKRNDSWWDSDRDGYCRKVSRLGDCKEINADGYCSYGERREP